MQLQVCFTINCVYNYFYIIICFLFIEGFLESAFENVRNIFGSWKPSFSNPFSSRGKSKGKDSSTSSISSFETALSSNYSMNSVSKSCNTSSSNVNSLQSIQTFPTFPSSDSPHYFNTPSANHSLSSTRHDHEQVWRTPPSGDGASLTCSLAHTRRLSSDEAFGPPLRTRPPSGASTYGLGPELQATSAAAYAHVQTHSFQKAPMFTEQYDGLASRNSLPTPTREHSLVLPASAVPRWSTAEGLRQAGVADLVASRTRSAHESHESQSQRFPSQSFPSQSQAALPTFTPAPIGVLAPRTAVAHKTPTPPKRLSTEPSSSFHRDQLTASAAAALHIPNGSLTTPATRVPYPPAVCESSRPKLRATRTQDQKQTQSPAPVARPRSSLPLPIAHEPPYGHLRSLDQVPHSSMEQSGASYFLGPASQARRTPAHLHEASSASTDDLRVGAHLVQAALHPGSGSSSAAWAGAGRSNGLFAWPPDGAKQTAPARLAPRNPYSFYQDNAEFEQYKQLLSKTIQPAPVNGPSGSNLNASTLNASFTFADLFPVAPSNLSEAWSVSSGESPQVLRAAATGSTQFLRRLSTLAGSGTRACMVDEVIDLDADASHSHTPPAGFETRRALDAPGTPLPMRTPNHVAHAHAHANESSSCSFSVLVATPNTAQVGGGADGVTTRAMARHSGTPQQQQLQQTARLQQQQQVSTPRSVSVFPRAPACTLSEPRFRAELAASKVAQPQWLESQYACTLCSRPHLYEYTRVDLTCRFHKTCLIN